MSRVAVARRDYRSVVQPRTTRWLLYFLVAVFALGAYTFPIASGPPTPSGRLSVSMGDFPGFMTGAMGLYLPLVGVVLGHKAIVAERDSGELALTLSLPHTRGDVILGKLLSRGGLLVAGLLAGLLVASVLVWYPYGNVEPVTYLAYSAVTLVFGFVFLSLAVAISTVTGSERLATALAIAVVGLFVVLWDLVRVGVETALDGLGMTGPLPDPVQFALAAEPVSVYERVVAAFWGGPSVPGLGTGSPWYLGGWVALGLLVAWAVVPLALSYWRFGRADL